MANIRVYDLAKQLGLENKALMKILADNGIEEKTNKFNYRRKRLI